MTKLSFREFTGHYECRIKPLTAAVPRVSLLTAAQAEFDQVTGVHPAGVRLNLQDFLFGFSLAAEALWWQSQRPFLLPYVISPRDETTAYLFRWAVHLPSDYPGSLQSFLAVPMQFNVLHSMITDPLHKIEVLERRIRICPDPPDMLVLHTLDDKFRRELYVGPARTVASNNPVLAEAHRVYLGCCQKAGELGALHPYVTPFRHRYYDSAKPSGKLRFEQEAINKTGRLGYELCRNAGLRSRAESRASGGDSPSPVLQNL